METKNMDGKSRDRDGAGDSKENRRSFLAASSTLAMSAGLIGGYGAFALIAGRFLYPAKPARRSWMFVAEAGRFTVGDSLIYRAPSGETITIARQGDEGTAGDFIALSSTCPHLGCQVHWEAHNNRFYCPCHNGVFDAAGRGTGGPPGEAGLTLPRYDLKIEEGLLYIEVPVDSLTAWNREGEVLDRVEGIHGPGHDPCLSASARRGGKRGKVV